MASKNLDKRVGEAIKLFWLTRDRQSESQGATSGQKDAGLRAAVTGGKHLDGFVATCSTTLECPKRMCFGKTVASCRATIARRRIGISSSWPMGIYWQ